MKGPAGRVLIYLADLTHTGAQAATESMSLNIGVVAAYVKKRFGNAIDVHLFKYPEALLEALRARVPHILGCSNYVWNSNLAEWTLGYARVLDPNVVTVQGGSNFPFEPALQAEFLRSRPNTDFHTFYEAEVAFAELVARYVDTGTGWKMKAAPIPGCHFLSADGTHVAGPPAARLKTLDEIPSPYVAGLMDHLFDGRLTPLIETTRGCPFSCNFCNAGDDYYNKVNAFSLDYVREELEYIAPRIAAAGVSNLWIADNNFGMFKRDAEVSRILRRLQERYRWPMGIMATTGKNRKERILETTEILGQTLMVSLSVQTMDQDVLASIKRDNIKLETYVEVNQRLLEQGRAAHAEVIFPLPGETYASFLRGIQRLIEAGTNRILSYTLLMNHGTEYKDPEFRRRHGYVAKWRVVPLDFGEYAGQRVFDAEEAGVATCAASFDDYLAVRGFSLLTEVFYNDQVFAELMRYLGTHDIGAFDWLHAVWERRDEFPTEVCAVFDSFYAETRSELWDSEAELRAFYSEEENYQRLVRGDIGGNVIFRHKARLMTRHMEPWIDFVSKVARDLLLDKQTSEGDRRQVVSETEAVRRYLKHRVLNLLDPDAGGEPIIDHFPWDVHSWMHAAPGRPLADFHRPSGATYRFAFSDDQLAERSDSFQRYGVDSNGLAKVFARISPLSRLFRHVHAKEGVPV
jgi:radical SAM superfamily enzyme YgiQ (UPF0313 family)